MIYTRYIDDSLELLLNRVFVGRARSSKLSFADVTANMPDTIAALFANLQLIGTNVLQRLRFPKTHGKRWTNVTLKGQR